MNEKTETPYFIITPKYYIGLGDDMYVVAMYVACTDLEAKKCEMMRLINVESEVYESIGPNSKYVNGAVIDGDERNSAVTEDSAISIKNALENAALQETSVIQLKLQAGRALTDNERTKLNSVLDYIDALNSIDISLVEKIKWPERIW
ncbi:tail fiber assembly protein [Serratia liquefaciens]